MTDHTLPAADVMAIHNISRQQLHTYRKSGKLSAKKRAGQWYYVADEVEQLRLARVQLLQVQLAQISESVEDYLRRCGHE